ncbi:hypothetical protein [Virgibacillus doumboii]|uniref:hypothetical protein n=1 Tax=Virgibacillus doumboii TaxID=2697503 RepID=UPI0013DFA366|nr:hypothetical protein [Virgibacillus doumboii]
MKDDYEELDYLGHGMDKDAGLDAFLPYRVVDIINKESTITVTVGADDPNDLLGEGVLELAREKAEFKRNAPCILLIKTPVITNGQNELTYQSFTFREEK